VRGIALGCFPGCDPAAAVQSVVGDRLGDLGVPVLAGLPVGHAGTNLTVALGSPVRLDADAGELVLSRPALC